MTAPPVLSQAALGRATLARQMLLAPSDRTPIEAVEHLIGLQAQAPLPPYYGLWSRLREFTPPQLAALLLDRSVVRLALMRSTVHLVSAADAHTMRPVLQPALERMFLPTASGRTLTAAGVKLVDLGRAGRAALADGPLSGKELGERLAPRWPGIAPSVLADGVRTAIPLVQVPPRGVWGAGGAPRLAALADWAPGEPSGQRPAERLIVRYLGAFGPASVADIQAWSGLTRLGEVVARLRHDLLTFRSESGGELLDLPAAPRPDAATPAPVRLIAEFDNLVLSHADRTRVIADADRRRMFTRNGIVPGLVLVDGVGQATWRLVRTKRSAIAGAAASVRIEEFRPLTAGQRAEIEAEARRMLAFASPDGEHDVTFAAAA